MFLIYNILYDIEHFFNFDFSPNIYKSPLDKYIFIFSFTIAFYLLNINKEKNKSNNVITSET